MSAASGFYTDISEAQWTIVTLLLPPAKPSGQPRTTSLHGVLDAVFYLLLAGLRSLFPAIRTVMADAGH